jgi:fatty-acyl-CoA synthase
MIEEMRSRLRRVESLARDGVFAARVLNKSGALGSFTPRGMARFFKVAAGAKPGPHTTLLLHACNRPNRLAVCDERRRLSWLDLNREVNQLCHGLASLGIRDRERVGVMMRNRVEYIVTHQALVRMGAVGVQIGCRLKPNEIAYVLRNAEVAAVVCHADHRAYMDEARALADCPPRGRVILVASPPGSTTLGIRYEDLISGREQDRPPGEYSMRGEIMIYTSGTTGTPKGASRPVKSGSMEMVGDFVARLGLSTDERHLIPCPLYHSAALGAFQIVFALGGTSIVAERFDARAVLETVERERITSMFLVPTMLERLLTAAESTERSYDLSSLRCVCNSGAPLRPDLARRFQQRFGPVLWNLYGATELGLVALASPGDHDVRPGTIGTLIRGNEARLYDEDGHEVEPGDIGELHIRSPMTIRGYHRDRFATERATRDGFFSVGDLARLDDDGYLYLEGRAHDMIVSGGVNIYPLEIENHLAQADGVEDCAVVGVPDDEWGERVKAFVVRRRGATVGAHDLEAWCRSGLADYKCPRVFEFIDELPRNSTGKVLKRELQGR